MVNLLFCTVFEKEAEAVLARWVNDDVVRNGLKDYVEAGDQNVMYIPVAPTSSEGGSSSDSDVAFVAAVEKSLSEHIVRRQERPTKDNKYIVLLLAVYWDGQTDSSKSNFVQLKQLSDPKSRRAEEWMRHLRDSSQKESSAPLQVEVLVQALNAKKGTHTMAQNRAALVSSLQQKLQKSVLFEEYKAGATEGGTDAATGAQQQAKEEKSHTATGSIGQADISVDAIEKLLEAAQGEYFCVVSAPSREELDTRVKELQSNCTKASVGYSAVLPEPREVALGAAAAAAGGAKKTEWAQEFLLRRNREGEHIQVRLAMCGQVDSGKSTLTSVLTRGCHDDGRGYARAFVFNHKHESVTGRTSSVSENHLGFSAKGDVVNYQLVGVSPQGVTPATSSAAVSAAADGATGTAAPAHHHTGPSGGRSFTPQELASRSAKVLTLYDLAGHEKYLKTTVLGMTRNMPDYACIVVSANNGIQRMTKEHLALCLALKLPFFITVTRIDATPENIHKETVDNIHKLMKTPTVRKLPYPVRKIDEMILAAKNLKNDRIAPIFELSNVTGEGVPLLLRFLDLLPQRKDWRAAKLLPRQMIIDSTFFVTGVGTVVGGIITQGIFHVNDNVLLGPDGLGRYRPASIKSIHVKGVDSVRAEAGNDAALCLKKEKRSAIRKGNILADPQDPPKSYWQFETEVTILYHSTTISVNYEPVIHSTTVRQSARITWVEKEVLRTGDRSLVRFHFLYRPEFMNEGQRLIFREGRTKGIGVVTKRIEEANEEFVEKNKSKRHPRAAGGVA